MDMLKSHKHRRPEKKELFYSKYLFLCITLFHQSNSSFLKVFDLLPSHLSTGKDEA